MNVVRARVRKKIENQHGIFIWELASPLAVRHQVAIQTIKNFAYGETRKPQPRTLNAMYRIAGYRFGAFPDGVEEPEGWEDFEKELW